MSILSKLEMLAAEKAITHTCLTNNNHMKSCDNFSLCSNLDLIDTICQEPI